MIKSRSIFDAKLATAENQKDYNFDVKTLFSKTIKDICFWPLIVIFYQKFSVKTRSHDNYLTQRKVIVALIRLKKVAIEYFCPLYIEIYIK